MFGLISILNSLKKERNTLRQKTLSYFLSINSELSEDGLLNRLNDSISGVCRWSMQKIINQLIKSIHYSALQFLTTAANQFWLAELTST